ncbi:Metabotropic glutamate receptor 5-like [Homarus americanus]|uniref:Metabotropic glutamate receptor 5-like n=1 Tax=Homarus americanus TaxID=6706 RepID=A0A8J5JCD7_HOMAM|nr:Metabotropic glutamate receptor 5-like [Homarus americanus]
MWWDTTRRSLARVLLVVVTVVALNHEEMIGRRRKTALLEGDILIGALFSVHHQPKQKSAFTLTCGEIREQYGIQRVEAAFMAIDEINANQTLLPNITLGVEIRDSCWYSSIALEQSIEFIRDALASPGDNANRTLTSDACKSASTTSKRLVGVVGPGSSDVTIQVQNLLQLFRIPQVGYSATSRDLSDKSRFSYFMRVVPSDYYQAQVMVDIVRHYNWTYVSAVHTDGNYGQSGITAFRELAEKNNICIAKEDSVLSNAEDEAFDMVIHQLREDQRANVVVCFCEGMTVRNLLLAAQRNNVTSRFLFIGSDGWADRSDVVAGLEEAAVGGLSVKITSSSVGEFDDHYFQLDPDNNKRNPWFKEFWQMRFNCSLPGHEEIVSLPPCSGMESLRDRYKQDTKMAFVMKAIYTMAWGLHNMQRDLCPFSQGLCESMLPINGSLYRDYLVNVTFSYMGELVTFDSRGDPPGRYDIMNYQRLKNGSFDYVRVGTWDNGTLVVHEERVVFNSSDGLPPTSSFVESGDEKCCWICTLCDKDEYLMNETTCQRCTPGYWPNTNKTGCDAIPVKYIMWDDAESIVALSLASLGFLATSFTMLVFIRYNHTPVVKASTRELSYIIFVGMMVSYCATLPLLARPTTLSCAVSRIMPGLSFAMIYAALVTKTNRIARILAGNKKIMMRKPRFMSATAQVIITCILISIEVGIITTTLILDPPDVDHIYPRQKEVKLVCNTPPRGIIAPMGWDFFLIAMCTVYAVKTRNLPENFNEAKFIGFSMYTTCVIWMAWLPIYFGSDHKIICMSMCTSLSAMVTLVLLFFPKIYIMLFRPEKNDRSAFKTATTVRCHIGSSSKASMSRPSDPSPSAAIESLYVGPAMLGIGQPQLSLMQRIRSTLGMPFIPPIGILPRDPNPRSMLRREISVWSDASGSAGTGGASSNNRDMMLRRAYGSQLDLTGGDMLWSREDRSSQTTDDLLDPLIPRLRRRVARAVRENDIDVSEGREFFSITHNWMISQAEAAKSAVNRQKNSEAEVWPTTTIIIREDLEVEEKVKEEKESKVKEPLAIPKQNGVVSDSEHSNIKNSYDASQETSQSVTKKKLDTKQSPTPGYDNTEHDKVELPDQNRNEKNSVACGGSPTTQDGSNLCNNNNCSQLTKVQDNNIPSENNSSSPKQQKCSENQNKCSINRQTSTDSQVVNFIGYGSVMPCSRDENWTKQRSVSCDNSIILKNKVVPLSQSTQTEQSHEKQGWISNSDSRNLVAETNDNNGKSDLQNRKRKVGVSARVSDVRGILKFVNSSPTERETRVSFDSHFSPVKVTTEDELLSPVLSDDDLESDSQAGDKQLEHHKLSNNSACADQHSISEETSFSILEEALSAESDIEASDNCELKTIIIRLGSDEANVNIPTKVKSEVNGSLINWRPKPGKNHKVLSYTPATYSYDNPSANIDSEVLYNVQDLQGIKTSDVSSVSHLTQHEGDEDPSKRYASENELVILDLLHSTFPQKYYNPQGTQVHCNSNLPQSLITESPTFRDTVTSEDPGSTSHKRLTITPPELYRNSPTKQLSPSQDPDTHYLQYYSHSIPSHKSHPSEYIFDTQEHSHHHKQPHRSPAQVNPTVIPADLQQIEVDSGGFSSDSKPNQHCTSVEAPRHITSTPQSQTILKSHCQVVEEGRHTERRLCRNDTDDDTDESTTPIEEFFRTHGIKFDVTSTKSKKL